MMHLGWQLLAGFPEEKEEDLHCTILYVHMYIYIHILYKLLPANKTDHMCPATGIIAHARQCESIFARLTAGHVLMEFTSWHCHYLQLLS